MLFSIIVVYNDNNKKFLKNCVNSLENQTYKDFEVLFLHNNSQYLNSVLAESSLNYKSINSELGMQDLRNLGITSSKGEYILFLDSDDFVHPNSLVYAKQIIEDEENENDNNVIKLGISKTNLDMASTLNKRKQGFYKDDTLDTLNQILGDLNIDTNYEQQKAIINGLFENNILNHKTINHTPKRYINKLSFSLKVHGLIVKKQHLLENNIMFEHNNDLYGEIPFVINLYNQTTTIRETYTKLYYKLIHNDPINYPSLTQREEDERLYLRMTAFKESLKYSDNRIILNQLVSKAISYYLYKVIKNKKFK